MFAMVLDRPVNLAETDSPLRPAELPVPVPGPGEVLVKVSVCGVCHTELDEIEGRTPPAFYPIALGHQVVGTVEAVGESTHRLSAGSRVGIAWLYSTCGACDACLAGRENLCPEFKATGRDAHGGYAQYMVAPVGSAFSIPSKISDVHAAPLLCAGAIGFRSLRLAQVEAGQALGLMGFGASAHLVLKLVRHRWPDVRVYVFARSATERAFAKELGAVWAGEVTQPSPEPLDSIIDTTPAWLPVLESLRNLRPGGRLVINAIRKEGGDQHALAQLDYARHLWLEKEIKSVANVTRADVSGFLALAAEIPIQPEVQTYPLSEANRALHDLKSGDHRGAKVLVVGA